MVKVLIDESGPGCGPWLDHHNPSALTETPGSLEEKLSYVRHVMQDIRHDNPAQGSVCERQLARVQNVKDAGTGENVGGKQT